MASRQCYHCKLWIDEGEPHDCWTTTEEALIGDLSEDLREAYARIRETALAFGEQRIYASHHSIMFSRKSCYFFVRPKKSFLEVCVFLGRTAKAPQIRRVDEASTRKKVHFIRVTHRDQVEPPITDWLKEAYEFPGAPAAATARRSRPTGSTPSSRRPGQTPRPSRLSTTLPGKRSRRS